MTAPLIGSVPHLGGRDEWKFSFEIQHRVAVHFTPADLLEAVSEIETVGGSFFFAVAAIEIER